MNKLNTTGILLLIILVLLIIITVLLFWKKPFTPRAAEPITTAQQVEIITPQVQPIADQTPTKQKTQTSQPALVKGSEKMADGTYSLSLDIVSYNPYYTAGGSEPYLVNQSTKVKTFTTTPTTTFFACGPDTPVLSFEKITATEIVIEEKDGIATSVQGICLP